MGSVKDIALKLHQGGYSIIPSGKGDQGKSPATRWQAYQNKQPTEETFRAWRRNDPPLWGIVTGKSSGVVIVDCDPGADQSILAGLEPHVRTPRGGAHYWFEHPGRPVKTCAGVLPKIDIRGDGGFANVVGKNPVTGGEYTIEIMPTRDALYSWGRVPKSILEAMKGEKKPEEGAIKFLEGVPEGERDWDAYRYACRLFGKGLSRDEVIPLVLKAASRCTPPFPEKETLAKVESASKYEVKQNVEHEVPQIISADTLMDMEFPPLIFAIPQIIPEGFTLLAGKPKAGKSWLALEAAYSVALGKNLLDGEPIERGRALVLGLEDGERRLKARLNKINSHDAVLKVTREQGGLRIVGNLGGVPSNIDLSTEWPRVGSGGIEELEKYLDDHPDVRLIVVDTIKRFTKKKGKGTAYDEDYESVQPLHDLAMKRRLPIVGVCHTRKALSDDPLDMVSGTFGLTGAVDNILVLQRQTEDEFRLSSFARDTESCDLALLFADCMWKLLGDADVYFVSEAREAIMECLMDSEPLGPKEIAQLTGQNHHTVRGLLKKMLGADQVSKDGKGKYSVVKRRHHDAETAQTA